MYAPTRPHERTAADAIDAVRETYGLCWPGKAASAGLASEPTAARTVPCPDEGVGSIGTPNLFIEGDNLDAMKLLCKTHGGRFKMIYADPPYNTGRISLNYHDDFSIDESEYRQIAAGSSEDSGRRHAAWLSMIYPRLLLARELLADDGAIFISIDDNEIAQLRLLCDEIFGADCFINQIAVKSSESSGVKMTHVERRLPKKKEYLLIYSRVAGGCRLAGLSAPKQDIDRYLRYYSSFIVDRDVPVERWEIISVTDAMRRHGIETTAENIRAFKIENAGRVVYRTNNALLAGMRFETETAEVISPRGRRYIWWRGKQMLFLSDHLDEALCDLWTDISTINLNKEMLGLPAFTAGQKPLALLERCIALVCPENEPSLVMDIFAGSGAFGHAAMRSAAAGRPVRFVSIQAAEALPPHFNSGGNAFATIADIAKERLRRAALSFTPPFGFRVERIAAAPQKAASL